VDVLVLGAAGFLGLHVMHALKPTHRVCGAHRRRTNTMLLRRAKVDRRYADLDEPESLVQAMCDQDVVVHAAGHYPRHSLDPATAMSTGVRQTQSVLDAAAQAGVGRLVYLSSTATVASNPYGPADERHVFAKTPGFGTYHDLKWAMEQLVLKETRFETIVLCPAACIGAFDLRVGTSALLVATARGMQPEHPDGLVHIVDARDVGQAVALAVGARRPSPRLLVSGGTYDLHALLVTVSDRYAVRAPKAALDAITAKRMADQSETLALEQGGRSTMVREIVDLVVHAIPLDASRICVELGQSYRPLTETLDTFDAFARRMRFIPPLPAEKQPVAPVSGT
jgi:dihydroflavonol-4-reductase